MAVTNPQLQAIIDDINNSITSKQRLDADPLKVLATDESRILTNLTEFIDPLTIPPTSQFTEWDPDIYYSNAKPDVVAYEGNTYMAINDTPEKGNQPDIATTEWEPVSSGEFAHQQNTDTHTNSRTFEIGHLAGEILDSGGTPITEPTGSITLIFGKANDDTNKMAFRKFWETPGLERLYYLQFTLNYTGTGSDVWVDVASGEDVADLFTAVGTIQADITDLRADVLANTTDISGKADKTLAINTQTANYTLVLADAGGLLRMNVATANTVTIPPNSSVAFPTGTQMFLSQAGAGQTTLVAGSGVTINSFGAKLKFAGQYAGVTLVKIATNTWNAYGNLTA